MILPIHIVIATVSLLFTAFLYLYPTKTRLNVSYALVAATLGTGFYLIASIHVNMTETCVTGLLYLGFISYGIVAAKHKLERVISK